MCISKLLKKCDLYSRPIPIFFKEKENHKTNFGGLLAILSSLIGIMFFILFGWDMFLQRNPKILTIIEELKKVELFRIQNGNMLIAARAENEFGQTISDDSIFEIKFQKLDYVKLLGEDNGWSGNITNLNSVQCNSSHLQNSELLETNAIKAASCPDLTSTYLGGLWSSNKTSHFRVIMLLCSNKTKGKEGKCKSQEQIDKVINSVWLNYYVTDYTINANNYKTPGTEKINFGYLKLSTSMIKTYEIYMNKVKVSTDIGFIMTDKSVKEYLVVDSINSDISLGKRYSSDFQADEVFYINLYQNNKVVIYEREYLKLQQILANVGGILKVVVIICQFLNNLVSSEDFIITLMNSFFFDFENLKNQPGTNKAEVSNVIKLKPIKPLVQSSISNIPNFQNFQDLVKESKRVPFKFNICTIFKLLFGSKCLKSNKLIKWEEELNVIKKKLEQTMEIENIISMHYQISTLKFIFLDKNQREALKFLNRNNNILQESVDSQFLGTVKNPQEVFESLVSSGGEIDNKILELLQDKEEN